MPNPRFAKNSKKKFNFHRKGKSTFSQSGEYQHHNQLCEKDVGITQFISSLEGYSGIIKARFSDFQVNEIDLNGEVAKLTNQKIPDFKKQQVEEVPVETPLLQIPQNIWEDVKKMLQSGEPTNVELDATELSKEDRGNIHECLRKHFGRKIVGTTVVKDEKKIMHFTKFDGKNDTRSIWPKDKGEYVHFLVYKESLDTLETTLRIASCVKISPSNFTYAGVKDKRAKTTQWFSVKQVEPWKLIIKTKCIRNVKLGNITFKDTPLKLGDLKGNKFRIALRNVIGNDDLVEKSLQSLKDNGFINYYGLQRFGNDKAVPTFAIGIQLLLGNWKEACQLILKPTESDRPDFDITKAKKVYLETGDAAKALEKFDENKKTSIEYLLLSGLSKGHANDFVNALSSVPRNTRLLYLHSFQSLVWNTVASKRIEKFGLVVVEGDLVFEEKGDNKDSEESTRPVVKTLTSDDCANYTIYDVVLPLPGYDITYPKNMEEFYKETIEKHGLTLEMAQQQVKEYSLSGTYRKLLGRVQNLSWKIMHYNDPNYNLIRSDFEELKGYPEPTDIDGGAYKALVLEFSLDSSCYATMVLRELLKTDTASSVHAKLNNYHSEPKEKPKTPENTASNENDCTENIDLLNDAQKFEAFKNLVFSEEESPLKRKLEGEESEVESAKVAKIEDNGS